MKNKYGEKLTPIVTNGFLQVNEMKPNDNIYQLTKEERELIMIALLNLQKTYHKMISEPTTAMEIKEVANLYGEELYKINNLLEKLKGE